MTSSDIKFSTSIDIILFSNSFTVSKLTVGVRQSPGYLIIYPPTFNLVLFLGVSFYRVTKYPSVGDLSKLILRYLFFFYERNCVCALDADFCYLVKVANFISKLDSSCISVLWVFPKLVIFK